MKPCILPPEHTHLYTYTHVPTPTRLCAITLFRLEQKERRTSFLRGDDITMYDVWCAGSGSGTPP